MACICQGKIVSNTEVSKDIYSAKTLKIEVSNFMCMRNPNWHTRNNLPTQILTV